jgi:hypothetical protein
MRILILELSCNSHRMSQTNSYLRHLPDTNVNIKKQFFVNYVTYEYFVLCVFNVNTKNNLVVHLHIFTLLSCDKTVSAVAEDRLRFAVRR